MLKEVISHLPIEKVKTAARVGGRAFLALAALPASVILNNPEPVSAIQTMPEPPRSYPQCGTGPGRLHNLPDLVIDPSHTVLVTPAFDGSGNLIYFGVDYGVKPSECGNPPTD